MFSGNWMIVCDQNAQASPEARSFLGFPADGSLSPLEHPQKRFLNFLTDAELQEWNDAVDENHQKVAAGETY
jgi:hypothetical protein